MSQLGDIYKLNSYIILNRKGGGKRRRLEIFDIQEFNKTLRRYT